MGAIDETGTLKENEIFIECKYGLFDRPCTYEGTIYPRHFYLKMSTSKRLDCRGDKTLL
jgi:hypothetical protein